MLDATLAKVLDIQPDADESDASMVLLSLVLAAITPLSSNGDGDESTIASTPVKALNLKELCSITIRSGGGSLIEPLTFVPPLIPVQDEGAIEMLALIGECGSAKEVIMVVQEVLELTLKRGRWDDDDGDDAESRSEGHHGKVSHAEQLKRLLELLIAAFPRLKLRRKSALETLEPLFEELWVTLENAGPKLEKSHGRALIQCVHRLVDTINKWVDSQSEESKQKDFCKDLLRRFVEHSISSTWHVLQSSLAQRTLKRCFPRLGRGDKSPQSDWEAGEELASSALVIYNSLGQSISSTSPIRSQGFFILLAHSLYLDTGKNLQDQSPLLTAFLPLIIASIQRTSAVDETLSFLLIVLRDCDLKSHQVSLDVVALLTPALASLASAHPDPSIRHQTFRALSLLLGCTEALFRLTQLTNLLNDQELPPMRVAAVGLVKEALLEALSKKEKNIIASPKFLQVFAPILFQPDPKDLFEQVKVRITEQGEDGLKATLDDFQESVEPARLTECLGLLYVLLVNDRANLTGIRDPDNVANIKNSLLQPMHEVVGRWMQNSQAHHHTLMPLVSLQIGLQRVDSAISELQSP